jgi:hypothetical protein
MNIDSISLVFLFIFLLTLFLYRSSPAENMLRELHLPDSTIVSKEMSRLLKSMSTQTMPVYTICAKKVGKRGRKGVPALKRGLSILKSGYEKLQGRP